MALSPFPDFRFKAQLRPSQLEVVEIAQRKLEAGQRRLHIVAPPGSGKTVLGLYLWAMCVRRPALVLSPNSAIQAQWAAKTELFEFADSREEIVSTSPNDPKLLTSLTYQSLTIPAAGDNHLESLALSLWQDKLVEKGQATDPQEADVWIDDLKRHNPDYYERRLSAYRKQVRDERAKAGESLGILHGSALATLERLRGRGLGLIIFDECHHLLGHWGRVLADAHDFLAQPLVVGLTATPPDRDGKQPADVERYDEFFGEVDYEVPVPAVVKDGFLAPFQDLAYIVRPTSEELAFVANADEQVQNLVNELCAPREAVTAGEFVSEAAVISERGNYSSTSPDLGIGGSFSSSAAPKIDVEDYTHENLARRESLPEWLERVLAERRLPTGIVKEWSSFERRDPEFATAARVFLLRRGWELPPEVPPPPEGLSDSDSLDMQTLVPVLDRYVRHRLRRSPFDDDRELAESVVRRLRILGAQITEVGCQPCASPVGRVLAYSQNKAAAAPEILRAELAVLGDDLRAVVVTDYEKTSAVTSEVKHLLDAEAGGAISVFKTLLADPTIDSLNPVLITGSSVLVDDDLAPTFNEAAQTWLRAHGCDVELVFSQEAGFNAINGIGSDWCPRIYVELITDLFQRGVTKCLVGTRGLLGEGWDANKINVLIDLTTVTTSMTVNQLRGRSLRLDPERTEKLADNWDVVCIAPEFTKGLDDYRRFIAKHKSLFGITDDGEIEKGVGHVHAAFTEIRPEGLEGSAQLLNADMLARVERRELVRELWKIGEPYHGQPTRALEARLPMGHESGFPPFTGSREAWNPKSLTHAVGEAVLAALVESKLVSHSAPLHIAERSGGYVRVLLENAAADETHLFITALQEALGPLVRPRYVIPRSVDRVQHTWLSKVLPAVVGRYFERRRREPVMLHAVPSILARNKELVSIYERHWNRLISPGEAVYALRGEGEQLIATATGRRQLPASSVHQKEIFR